MFNTNKGFMMTTKQFFFLLLVAAPLSVSARGLPTAPLLPSSAIQAAKAITAKTSLNCRVVGVSDGDTFTCLTDDKKQIRVRMNNIDAPEKAQPYGQKAKQALSSLIFNKTVTLTIKSSDRYGRSLADVVERGRNINKIMVVSGYAWAYREYLSDDSYLSLENDARSHKRGLWAALWNNEQEPVYPSKWRNKK